MPNATVMLIMDADRFGLSPPIARSGRRGDSSPAAVLVANPRPPGKKRMKIMTETTNGFVLAEEDLKCVALVKSSARVNLGFQSSAMDNVEDYPILEEARKSLSNCVHF